MASDSEIEDDISTPVVKAKGVLKKKGLTFVIGSWPGFTKSKIERIITEDAGGKSTKDYTDIDLMRVICSPNTMAHYNTQAFSLTLKSIMAANRENATEDDPVLNRVWILPLEWLQESIKAGKLLDEEEHDLELILKGQKKDQAKAYVQAKKEGRAITVKDRRRLSQMKEVKEMEAELEQERRDTLIAAREAALKASATAGAGGGPSMPGAGNVLGGAPPAPINPSQAVGRTVASSPNKREQVIILSDSDDDIPMANRFVKGPAAKSLRLSSDSP